MINQVTLVVEMEELAIALRGDLAAILRFAAGKKNPGFLWEAGTLFAIASIGGCVDTQHPIIAIGRTGNRPACCMKDSLRPERK
ncbi:hypothetical protein ACVWW6_000368 [Bradyrhizobium sp. USDA 3311]